MTATAITTITTPPRTLAEFKRALQPGIALYVDYYLWREFRGLPQTTVSFTIHAVNSVGFSFIGTPAYSWESIGKQIYHRYGKSDEYVFHDTGFNLVDPKDGTLISRYHYSV